MTIKKEIQEALDKVTIEMIDKLNYSDEIELTKDYCLYHYSSDDIIVLNNSEEWVELLQIFIDEDEITFEVLDNDVLVN